MPDNVRFDLEYWQQIARHMAGTQNELFAVVKNPANGEYFPRSLKSAQDFKNDIVWSTDQPDSEPELKPNPVPAMLSLGMMVTMIAGGVFQCMTDM